jgi:hypothetical protein
MSLTSLISSLPSEIMGEIYEMSDYKNDLKKYFQRNVLTHVDPTLCFLSNKHCNYCFVRECEIKNGQKSFSDVCFGCKQKRCGDVMVSAHDANKQWRPEYKLLVLFGPEHWKRAMFYWVPCQFTFQESNKCNPVIDCLNDMFHRRLNNNAKTVVEKARRVALSF